MEVGETAAGGVRMGEDTDDEDPDHEEQLGGEGQYWDDG